MHVLKWCGLDDRDDGRSVVQIDQPAVQGFLVRQVVDGLPVLLVNAVGTMHVEGILGTLGDRHRWCLSALRVPTIADGGYAGAGILGREPPQARARHELWARIRVAW